MTFKEKIPKQYFSVVLFIMLNKVVLTLETVNEIVKRDHSNETCRRVLSYGTVERLTIDMKPVKQHLCFLFSFLFQFFSDNCFF